MKRNLLFLIVALIFMGCKAERQGNEDFELSKSELYMQLMETVELAVIGEYATSPNLVWTSLNPSVASVSKDGKVVAVSAGKTEIYAFVNGLNTVRGVCKIEVSNEVKSNFEIEAVSNSVQVGDVLSAKYVYTPALPTNIAEVSVVTSDSVGPKLVSIKLDAKTGVMKATALNPGVVRVKLINKMDKRVKDSIDITIEEPNITTFKFANVVNDIYEMSAGGNGKLELEIAPVSAKYKSVYWKSSDPSIVSVKQDGSIAAVARGGSAKISAMAPNGLMALCEVKILPIGGDLQFTKKTIIVESIGTMTQNITLGLDVAPSLASVTVRRDNSYAPKTGFVANLTIKDNNTAVYKYASSQVGTDRIIAESTKEGKIISDTCYVTVKDVSDALFKCTPTYIGVELGAKTLFTAKFANFTGTNAVLNTVELIEIKYHTIAGKTTEDWVVVETLANLNKTVKAESATAIDFVQAPFAPIKVVAPRDNFRVRYTYTVGAATNTVVRKVTSDNGAAFAPRN